MGRLHRACGLLIAALVLAACGLGSGTPTLRGSGARTIAVDSKLLDTAASQGIPQVGEPAPDFEYTLADGTTHKLSDLRGKKVVLNFWATWCGPCRVEMPDLQKALEEHNGEVVILGVNKLEQADVIPAFADEFDITFPLIANPAGDISDRYGANNIPTSYFINRDGTIAFRQIGVMNYGFIKERLDQLK